MLCTQALHQAKACQSRSQLGCSDSRRGPPRRRFAVRHRTHGHMGQRVPLPDGNSAGYLKVQMGWCARDSYQRVNRGIAAMLDRAGRVITVMHWHRNGLYARTRAHHDVDALATGVGYHSVKCRAQRKPSHGQSSNSYRQPVKALLVEGRADNIRHSLILCWLSLCVVNQGKP